MFALVYASRVIKRTIVASALVLGSLAAAAPVYASPYSGPPSLSVDDPETTPNQPITVTFTGFAPGETINVTNTCGDATSVTANGSGEASLRVNAPNTPGDCTVTGTGATSSRTDSAAFTVASLAPIPATGSDSSNLLVRSAQALGLGVVLVGITLIRRRRNSPA